MLDPSAIYAALRGVLEDETGGTLRPITASTYSGDTYEEIERKADAVRSISAPTIEATVLEMEPHEDTPMVLGSYALLSARVRVRVTRSASAHEKVSPAQRDILKSAVALDTDRVRQALTYPGALTGTQVVSGLLRYVSSSYEYDFDGATSARAIGTHEFRAVLQVPQAVS